MTNRKIKDYHKNKLTYDILYDNFKMLCIVLLCLHKHFPKKFYRLNVQKWLEEHIEWCNMMEEYEASDVYDFKMKEFCDSCGIADGDAYKIVCKHLRKYSPTSMTVLAENVKLALVHTVFDFGFGKIRLGRLVEFLKEEQYVNWEEDVNKLGIEVDRELQDIDYRKLKPKKDKPLTLQEQKEAAQKLAEYRAYFDYVMSKEEDDCL